MKTGDVLLRFDIDDLERQIAKLNSRSELNAVAAERLSDGYLTKYVYRPLDELVEVRRKEYEFSKQFMKSQSLKHRVGDVRRAGVIDAEQQGTIALSRKDLQDARFAFDEAKAERAKKSAEVNEEKAKNSSEAEEIEKSKALFWELVAMRTVQAPIDGVVTYRCVAGQFVDEGDVVAEIMVGLISQA